MLPSLLVLCLAAAASTPGVTAGPDPVYPGGVLVIDVHGVAEPASLGGMVDGQPLRFFAAGPGHQRALVGLRLELAPGKLPVEIAEQGSPRPLATAVEVGPRAFARKQLRVSKRFTSPTRQAKAQIAGDRQAIALAYGVPFGPAHFVGRLAPPRDAPITAHFGDERVFNGKKQSQHYGTDFDGAIGDPIRASADGVVRMARGCYTSGGTVILAHGGGLFTSYFHMSRIDVKPGDAVKQGQVIGLVGKSGRATGPHLHFGVKVFSRLVSAEDAFRVDLGRDPAAAPPL